LRSYFLHRYLFVLVDDAARSTRALALRSGGNASRPTTVASLLGLLLLRTWQRAERIHLAMLARAYQGELHSRETWRFAAAEVAFVIGWVSLFGILRYYDLTRLLGTLVARVLP